MSNISKYTINPIGKTSLDMPKDAKILDVQVIKEKICLWTVEDTENSKEQRDFRVDSTGDTIDPMNLNYIKTFQLASGNYIGHLFEIV